jgi:hypothetical protein
MLAAIITRPMWCAARLPSQRERSNRRSAKHHRLADIAVCVARLQRAGAPLSDGPGSFDSLRRDVTVTRCGRGQPDVDVVVDRVLEPARVLTGARYATFGVLGSSRTELERFITVGPRAGGTPLSLTPRSANYFMVFMACMAPLDPLGMTRPGTA